MRETRARFLGAWNEHRQIYGYTLLAELPYALLRGLRDHPELGGVDYDLVVVDEYQDLNACDLEVLRQILVLVSDVRFGAVSRRRTSKFRNSGRLRLLPSRQRTSRRGPPNVCN